MGSTSPSGGLFRQSFSRAISAHTPSTERSKSSGMVAKVSDASPDKCGCVDAQPNRRMCGVHCGCPENCGNRTDADLYPPLLVPGDNGVRYLRHWNLTYHTYDGMPEEVREDWSMDDYTADYMRHLENGDLGSHIRYFPYGRNTPDVPDGWDIVYTYDIVWRPGVLPRPPDDVVYHGHSENGALGERMKDRKKVVRHTGQCERYLRIGQILSLSTFIGGL